MPNVKGVDFSLMTIGEVTADELIASMGMDGKVVMFGSTGGRVSGFARPCSDSHRMGVMK